MVKKLTRLYWLGELKRARLEKDSYIDKMMGARFSALDSHDGEARVLALDFCEKNYLHFYRTLETWINDNYPAPAIQPQLTFDEHFNF